MNIIFTVIAFIISFPLVKIFGIAGGAISYLAVMFIRMLCYMIMTLRKLKGKNARVKQKFIRKENTVAEA